MAPPVNRAEEPAKPAITTQQQQTERVPAPPVRSEPAAPKPELSGLLANLQDAFFDYDRSLLRSDAQSALRSDVETLKLIFSSFPDTRFTVEGHCDERGSAEYNMGLGDLRARAARDFLVEFGVPADRLVVISFGKERPQCSESFDTCWQKNRRAHLTSSHP